MRDFTLHTFRLLLSTLQEHKFNFQNFSQFLKDPAPRAIILRHDVDARKLNSLETARIENELGISGTYNFRMVPESFDEGIIRQIVSLGHEIGYHYEDLTVARGKVEQAIQLFEQNLAKLRQLVPIETICMHGSPLSKYDNRKLWERYNYRDYGITGEPYFDMDFNNILYLTDTGRRWNGESVSVWDKVFRTPDTPLESHDPQPTIYNLQPMPKASLWDTLQPNFHSTFDIIKAASDNLLSPQIMITIHPQRWDNRLWPWISEYVWQNIKNVGKRLVVRAS